MEFLERYMHLSRQTERRGSLQGRISVLLFGVAYIENQLEEGLAPECPATAPHPASAPASALHMSHEPCSLLFLQTIIWPMYTLSPKVCSSKFFCLPPLFAISVPTIEVFRLSSVISRHISGCHDIDKDIENQHSQHGMGSLHESSHVSKIFYFERPASQPCQTCQVRQFELIGK